VFRRSKDERKDGTSNERQSPFRRRKDERKDEGQSPQVIPALDLNEHISYPEVILSNGTDSILVITCLPSRDLFATLGHDGIIRVYSLDKNFNGGVHRMYNTYNKLFISLILLFDDVLAFIGEYGGIVTWNANTGAVLSEFKAENLQFSVITKLNSTRIVVGTVEGDVLIVSHTNGYNLVLEKALGKLHAKTVKDIAVNGDVVVTGGIDEKAVVYNTKTNQEFATFRNGDWVLRVVMSSNYVVTCAEDSTIYIQHSDSFIAHLAVDFDQLLLEQDETVREDEHKESIWIMDMMFLTPELIMMTTLKHGIIFFSIVDVKVVARLNPGNRTGLRSASILSDGRICVGGYSGYGGIFRAPPEVADSVSVYLEHHRYPILSLLSMTDPLKSLWHAIHDKNNGDVLTLQVASEVLSGTNFCTVKTLEEWTYGHYLLMNFVRRKVIPSKRSYKGSEIFWWDKIYVRATSFEMSEEDLNLVLKFIVEAESTGIIGAGCAEMFKETRNLRKEFTVTTTQMSGMILELFCNQVATDASIRELFHYQKIQVAVQFFSAILSCIPFAGGVIAHLLSGGSSVLTHVPGEGFAVSGLVESLFGIGKDWSTLISEPVIQRVLQVTNRILHKETWESLPVDNRSAVEDAADGLKISVGDLREKVAGYFSPTHHPNGIEQLTKEVRELKSELQRMKIEKQEEGAETRRVLNEMKRMIEQLRQGRTEPINVLKENQQPEE